MTQRLKCLFLIIVLLGQYSCDFSNAGGTKMLPDSSGSVDELMIVMDENEWQDAAGRALHEILTEEFEILPQVESRFRVHQIEPNVLGDLFSRSSTILYVAPLDSKGATAREIKKKLKSLKDAGSGSNMAVQYDVWARPQQVIYLYANTRAKLIKAIAEKKNQIIKQIYKIENIKAQRSAYISGKSMGYQNYLKENFQIDMAIPSAYREVVKTDNFIWFRQDSGEEVSNIMIRSEAYSDSIDFSGAYPIATRNDLGLVYVQSQTEGSYMRTDNILMPTQKMTKIDGLATIESRGLWEMTDDFMGGPFLNYCINDTLNQRLLVLEGFVYAPQGKKKIPMRNLESIFLSAEIAKSNESEAKEK